MNAVIRLRIPYKTKLGIYWLAQNLLDSLLHEVSNAYLIFSSLKH